MSIESKLKEWAKSKKGQAKIEAARRDAAKRGVPFGNGGGSKRIQLTPEMMDMVNDLIHTVQEYLPESLRSSELMDDTSYIVMKPRVSPDGRYLIGIKFSDAAVYRPSVAPDDYDGVPNIVLHLSRGWHARGSIRGEWHGQEILTRRTYGGEQFMQEAINEFNMTHASALAVLNDDYTKAR